MEPILLSQADLEDLKRAVEYAVQHNCAFRMCQDGESIKWKINSFTWSPPYGILDRS